jgi:hypothetical protein
VVSGKWVREEELNLSTRELATNELKGRKRDQTQLHMNKFVSGLGLVSFFLFKSHLGFAGAPALGSHFPEIYGRATVSFWEADFFKPVECDSETLTFKLAPLLIQEVEAPARAKFSAARFGTLRFTNGIVKLDDAQSAIYVEPGTVVIRGKPHVSFTYLWFYRLDAAHGPGGGVPVQGVRLTLNSAGQPVVWEILAEPSGADLIFVSQSLERAAAAQFGKPLPGRRYTVERGTNEAPATIVARIIEDGPVAMGPIIYLTARTRAVSTLICRCMPAQAKTLRATTRYNLTPLPRAAPELLQFHENLRAHGLCTFWPGDKPTEERLVSRLRLPDEF